MQIVRLLLVDDHQLFRKSLVILLSIFENKLQISEASNGLEALEVVRNNEIDIVLMDIQMPKMNGIECLKQMKETYPQTKVIILTQFDDPSLIIHLIKLRADGFLLKESHPDELERAIITVLKKGQYYTELVQETLALSLGKNGQQLAQLDISPREFQVANLLKDGCSTIEIAEKLGLSTSTISSYRKSILVKTKCRNVADLVKLLLTTGMVMK